MSRSSSLGNCPLTQYFAIGALIVLAAAAAVSIELNRSLATRQLHDSAARHEVARAQTMAATPWRSFAYFVRAAGRLKASEIRAYWQTQDLLQDMPSLLAGTRVLRIRLYDARGIGVFSFDTPEIDRIGYVGPSLRTALGGKSAGGLSFVEHSRCPEAPSPTVGS
jgi:hypothetical protein